MRASIGPRSLVRQRNGPRIAMSGRPRHQGHPYESRVAPGANRVAPGANLVAPGANLAPGAHNTRVAPLAVPILAAGATRRRLQADVGSVGVGSLLPVQDPGLLSPGWASCARLLAPGAILAPRATVTAFGRLPRRSPRRFLASGARSVPHPSDGPRVAGSAGVRPPPAACPSRGRSSGPTRCTRHRLGTPRPSASRGRGRW